VAIDVCFTLSISLLITVNLRQLTKLPAMMSCKFLVFWSRWAGRPIHAASGCGIQHINTSFKNQSFLATAITVYISTSQPDNKNTQI